MRDYFRMTDDTFSDFYKSLLELAKSFEEKNALKIQPDLDANIIKIYGEKTDSLERAKAGLEEVSEIAYSAAEHHPYWSLIYNASQISKLALEKWNDELTREELDEISWCSDELKNTSAKLKEKQNHC
jgi:pterin-4a-carbinolamine dehydratase